MQTDVSPDFEFETVKFECVELNEEEEHILTLREDLTKFLDHFRLYFYGPFKFPFEEMYSVIAVQNNTAFPQLEQFLGSKKFWTQRANSWMPRLLNVASSLSIADLHARAKRVRMSSTNMKLVKTVHEIITASLPGIDAHEEDFKCRMVKLQEHYTDGFDHIEVWSKSLQEPDTQPDLHGYYPGFYPIFF